MTLLRQTMLALALLGATFLPGAGAMAQPKPHHFVFSITTDEGWTAGSALTQALVAAELGHEVTVLLSVRGIYLAQVKSAQGGFAVTAKSPREMLARLIRDGHAVLVCGVCMVAGGMDMEDLIEGATISGPEATFDALTMPDTVVLSY